MTDEATLRRDLAAAYRLAARRGWDDIVWTHISASLPGRSGEGGAYLINRFGLRFAEVRPDNLVMVDVDGRVIDGSNAAVNPSGFAIHGAVHAARPDAVCVMHLHTLWGQTLAAMPEVCWRARSRHCGCGDASVATPTKVSPSSRQSAGDWWQRSAHSTA